MNKLTHEQFDKMWEDSTKEEVLFQFYYDYYAKVEALDKIDKALEFIRKYKLYWDDTPEELIKYIPKELEDILRGEE